MEQIALLDRINNVAIQPKIFVIRGRQVMLATDLAPLFQVPAKILNQQIRRNEKRFPSDFGFRLTAEETAALRLHFEASNIGRGGHRHPPFAVTEYGVVMLANVLNSARAIAMSVEVVREFVRLRTISGSHASLKEKIRELKREVKCRLDKHEAQIAELFTAVEALVGNADEPKPAKQIGFIPESP